MVDSALRNLLQLLNVSQNCKVDLKCYLRIVRKDSVLAVNKFAIDMAFLLSQVTTKYLHRRGPLRLSATIFSFVKICASSTLKIVTSGISKPLIQKRGFQDSAHGKAEMGTFRVCPTQILTRSFGMPTLVRS